MARLSTPHARDGTASPRRWIAFAACALGVGAAAVVVLLWLRPDPAPVSAPQRPAPSPPAQVRPTQPTLEQVPEPRTEASTPPKPAQPAAPALEAHPGASGVLAVPLVVPMHATTIPEVRIPAGTRGMRLLLDVPIPRGLEGLTVWVRGPEGRVPARLTRTGESRGLAIELDAAFQAGVHELLVTNDDETTLAHHRIRAVPAGAAQDSASSP